MEVRVKSRKKDELFYDDLKVGDIFRFVIGSLESNECRYWLKTPGQGVRSAVLLNTSEAGTTGTIYHSASLVKCTGVLEITEEE